jgi:magnesium transporter
MVESPKKQPRRRKRRHIPVVMPPAPPGSSPSELIASPEQLPSTLRVMAYGANGCVEASVQSMDDIAVFQKDWPNVWVQVIGLNDVAMMDQLGARFGIHKLALEDILNVTHRAKVEEFDEHVFVILKIGHHTHQFSTEHFCMVLKNNLVISFQESDLDPFALVKDRIINGRGKIRSLGSDYLAYALLDAIVDSYYPILESLNHTLEHLENDVIHETGSKTISRIHHLKSDLLYMHRAIYPMRDIINVLAHDDSPFINSGVLHYLHDCHDQCVQITELTEFYRDLAAGLMNTYLALSGHKMNETIKVLTLVSAIFIPLTFIVGVYGMNFNTSMPLNMPELNNPYGYLIIWSVMIAIALFMVMWFRKKGWLLGSKPDSGGE